MGSLFDLAYHLGVASWFLVLLESFLMWAFVPLAYRVGVRVLAVTAQLPRPCIPTTWAVTTDFAKIKFISPDLCLFRPRLRLFTWRLCTPFPVKGEVRWGATGTRIVGRIPLSTTLFFAAWLLGWTASGLSDDGVNAPVTSVLFVLAGWIFVAAIVAFSIWYEREQAQRFISELPDVLALCDWEATHHA